MLVTVHATDRIGWQREKLPRMVAGLEALGVPYRVTDARHREDDGLAVLFGTSLWGAVEAGGPFLLVDRCSFGDTERYVTLVRDGHGRRGDHRVPDGYTGERWRRHGVEVKPWKAGMRVVLCGQTQSWSPDWPDLADWYRTVPATHFRRHPAGDNPTGLPEARSWDNAGLAVTLNSSVGVAAVLEGVPTVTMDAGAMAWAVTGHAADEIVKPVRADWLNWLAWTQWSWDEISEGKPWAHLL